MKAGALLFTIITAFLLSLVGATLVLLTTNQYRMINSEINRTIAFYRAQAGMEYAIYKAYTDPVWLTGGPYTVSIGGQNVSINIETPDPDGLSTYRFRITTNY